MSERSTGIIVLGMHRAGTSLATGLVAEMGFDATAELQPPADDNPKGYWEHSGVVEAHEEFLRSIGRTWTDARPLPVEVFSGKPAQRARATLRAIVKRDFLTTDRWVLKDPRMCRLMPLWKPVLGRAKVSVRYLHVLRSPTDVARSLAIRDGLGHERSLLLWLRHVVEAERFTRGSERSWFELESFEEQPEQVVRDLAEWLGVLGDAAADNAVSSIYDRTLIHHRSRQEPGPEIAPAHPWIDETHDALRALCHAVDDEERTTTTLDRIAAEIDRADGLLVGDPAVYLSDQQLDHTVRMQRELLSLERSIEAQRMEIDTERQEIESLRNLVVQRTVAQQPEGRDELAKLHDLAKSSTVSLAGVQEQLLGLHTSVEAQRREIEVQRQETDVLRELIAESVPRLEKSFGDDHATFREELLGLHKSVDAQREEINVQRRETDVLREQIAESIPLIERSFAENQSAVREQLLGLYESVEAQRKEIEVQRRESDVLRELVAQSVPRIEKSFAEYNSVNREQLLGLYESVEAQRKEIDALREQLPESMTRVEHGVSQTVGEALALLTDQAAARTEQQTEIIALLQSAEKNRTQADSDLLARLEGKHINLLEKSLEVTREVENELVRDRETLAQEHESKVELEGELARTRDLLASVQAQYDELAHHHHQAVYHLKASRAQHDRAAKEMQSLSNRLLACDEALAKKNAQLDGLSGSLSARKKDLDECGQQISRLEELTEQLSTQKNAAALELTDLRAELNYMRASVSWRWTAPIRRLRKIASPSSGPDTEPVEPHED